MEDRDSSELLAALRHRKKQRSALIEAYKCRASDAILEAAQQAVDAAETAVARARDSANDGASTSG